MRIACGFFSFRAHIFKWNGCGQIELISVCVQAHIVNNVFFSHYNAHLVVLLFSLARQKWYKRNSHFLIVVYDRLFA